MATITKVTLLDLVRTVSDFSASDAETVATVAYLVNSGKVRLCGNFAGAKIDLSTPRRVPVRHLSSDKKFAQNVTLAVA